jgi:hypothetical protein
MQNQGILKGGYKSMIKFNENGAIYNTIISVINNKQLLIKQVNNITKKESTVILKPEQLRAAGIKLV